MTDLPAAPSEPAVLPSRQAAQRASDLDRQAVVDRLRVATSEGRLTLDEFADRVALVLEARTNEELEPLTADLPAVAESTAQGAVAPLARRRDTGTHRRRLVNAFGGACHAGAWEAAREMTIVAIFGHSLVDLTACRLAPGVNSVDLRTVGLCAGIELVVPAGAVVDAGGFTLFGGRRLHHEDLEHPDPVLRVRIRSYGLFGGVLVRSARRVP